MRKNKFLIIILLLTMGFLMSGCEFIDYLNNGNNVNIVEETPTTLAELLEERDILEIEIVQLESDKASLLNELVILGIQKNDLSSEIINLQGVIDSLTDLVDSKTLIVENTDLEIIEKNNSITNLDRDILALETLLAEYEEDITNIEDLSTEITQLENDRDLLIGQKSTLEGEVGILNTSKGDLLSDISNLTTQKNIVSGTVNNLNNQVFLLEADKLALQTDIGVLNQELLDLEQQAENYYLDLFTIFNEISWEVMKANVVVKKLRFSTERGSGSGIIIKETATEYFLLTNNHVVYDKDFAYSALNYKVLDYKGNAYSASLNFYDANYDLALLRFTKHVDFPLKVMTMLSVNPAIGEKVVAIGQPEAQTNTVTFGKVSAYRTLTLDEPIAMTDVKFNVIFHNAPIKKGSSGGVLINLDLDIVGINYAGSESGGTFYGAYAIPVEKVHLFLTGNNFTL